MLDTKLKWFCVFVVLGLGGCSTTKLNLTSEKENISNTTIIFVERGIPVRVEEKYPSNYSYSGGALGGALSGLIVGLKKGADRNSLISICDSCPDFDYHEPVRKHLLKMFSKLNWMGNESFCIVDSYKKVKEELLKITPGTLYIVVYAYYVFGEKFVTLTGNCDLELYKYNEKFDPNLGNRRKNLIAKKIYEKRSSKYVSLKKYNYVFGIDKNVKQWYGKLPEHIENFAEAFAKDYFEAFKD